MVPKHLNTRRTNPEKRPRPSRVWAARVRVLPGGSLSPPCHLPVALVPGFLWLPAWDGPAASVARPFPSAMMRLRPPEGVSPGNLHTNMSRAQRARLPAATSQATSAQGGGGRTDAPTLENHDAHGARACRKQSRLGGSAEPRGLQALGKGTGPVVSPPPSRPRACLFLPFCRTPRGRLRKQERGERLGQPAGAQRKGHNGWGAPLSPGSPALGPPDHCRVQGRECSQVPTAPGGSAGPALGAPRQPSAFPEAPSHHSRSRGTLVFGLLFTLL